MKRIVCVLCVLFWLCGGGIVCAAFSPQDEPLIITGTEKSDTGDSGRTDEYGIINNGIYEFIAMESVTTPQSSAKALNVWSVTSSGAAEVNLCAVDHSDMQRWKAVCSGEANGAWRLESMANTGCVLDSGCGSIAADGTDIYPRAATAAGRADQLVNFTFCGTYKGNPVYYIDRALDGAGLSAGIGTCKMSVLTDTVYFSDSAGNRQKWIAVFCG